MFKVGDIVDVKERDDLDYFGRIVEINEDKAVVRLKFTRHPEGRENGVCESCGSFGHFSVNGGTGEIVCMRTGCGHEYGFIERDEVIALEKLINITEKRNQEKKQKLVSEIKLELKSAKDKAEKAFKDGLIDEKEKAEILKAIS